MTSDSSPASTPAVQPETPAQLIVRGYSLGKRMAEDKAEMDKINAALQQAAGLKAPGSQTLKAEDGTYVIVIHPKDAVKPEAGDIEPARKICGAAFGKLFKRTVTYKPVEKIANVAAAVLTPKKFIKLIAQLAKPGTTFVKWS